VHVTDLRSDKGRDELREFLVSADLLLTSQRPSALARLGLSRDALAALNPDLCWVEIVGDTESPETPGHDLTYQLEAGLLAPPMMPRTLIADLAGARQAVRAAWRCCSGARGAARHGTGKWVSSKPPKNSLRP